MKLPGADRARIDPLKIRDYLLSTSHPVGRFKGVFFAGLGYSAEQWEILEADLRELALSAEAQAGQPSPYGQKYEIRGILTGPAGRSAEVLTVWIVLAGEDAPQFVTAFPGGTA